MRHIENLRAIIKLGGKRYKEPQFVRFRIETLIIRNDFIYRNMKNNFDERG